MAASQLIAVARAAVATVQAFVTDVYPLLVHLCSVPPFACVIVVFFFVISLVSCLVGASAAATNVTGVFVLVLIQLLLWTEVDSKILLFFCVQLLSTVCCVG